MGGSKNKSPAQKEKSQQQGDSKKPGSKKGKKGEKSDGGQRKAEISVIIDEAQALKFIQSSKVITVQELARQTGVKISAANACLKKLAQVGKVRTVGGFSGHRIYQPVTA